ncbi:hypothetical protein GGX14DRAFT_460924 [Mycena pura]|uniref:Uncharacterized protein n=1 Tax=Mycena pura TaxID=153505 RepID=A0AAD6V6Y1_9AGAR|nr:hypothetical protein GGX14DRAFT_460924 [Mycena pura]
MEIQLTQQRLRSVARPLLFRHFTFHIDGNRVSLLLQRLEYWSSPEIAPCVRECSLTGQNRLQSVLSQAFLSRLPRFTNLRQFSMQSFMYTPTFFQALQSLPALRHLESCHCFPDPAVSADDWRLLIPLDLTFIHIHHLHVGGDLTRHVRHDTVCSMEVFLGEQSCADILAGDPFPLVKHLLCCLAFKKPSASSVSHLLSQFPAIEVLHFPSKIDESTFAASSKVHLPSLTRLTGNPRVLSLLQTTAALRYLNIDYGSWKPREFLAMVHSNMAGVISLCVSFTSFSYENICDLSRCFPGLQSLRVDTAAKSARNSVFQVCIVLHCALVCRAKCCEGKGVLRESNQTLTPSNKHQEVLH